MKKIITTLILVAALSTYAQHLPEHKPKKKEPKSEFYIYGSVGFGEFQNPEGGVIYTYKQRVGLIASVEYNASFDVVTPKLGFLIKIR